MNCLPDGSENKMLRRGRLAGGMCLLLLGLVSAAFAADSDGAPAKGATPKVGEPAADFALPTVSDKEVKLSELRAQGPVVLIVLRGWVGYQCPVCTKQVGDFAARAK